MALTYEQLKQKIAALSPSHAEVEELMREIYSVDGQIGWDADGNPTTSHGVITPVAITSDYTAEAGNFITATASTVDITVTLPAASGNTGKEIFIHKADATSYKILTSVKDISFQNSTMHLISNGTEWVVS